MMLLVWVWLSDSWQLPEAIISVQTMVQVEDRLFLYDAVNRSLFALDKSGEIVAANDQRGLGPHEFQDIGCLKYFRDRLWACDPIKRSIFQLDRNLKVTHEEKYPFLPRDVLWVENRQWVVGFEPRNGRMVQVYDEEGHWQFALGLGLEDVRLVGSQAGWLVSTRDSVFFVHLGLNSLQSFGLGGDSGATYRVPGLPDEPFLSFESFSTTQFSAYQMAGAFLQGSCLVLRLKEFPEPRRFNVWFYKFDLTSHRFLKRRQLNQTVLWDQFQHVYVLERDDQDRIHLVPIQI